MSRAVIASLIAFSLAVGSAQASASAITAGAVAPTDPSPWRADFSDPVLADLLRRADLESLDIRMALARLARARAEVDLARAAHAPHLDIGGEAALGGESFSSSRGGAGAPVAASYELDVFGRLARAVDAAKADQQAVAQDVTGARLLVGAEVTRAYLDLRAAQAARSQSSRQSELSLRSRALVAQRRAEGRATAAEMAEAESAAAEAAGELQGADLAVTRQLIRLGQLLGQPKPLSEPPAPEGAWPATPQLAALPSDVILRRPDILAAAARLTAADARHAEAVAATRPRFTLTAAFGSGDPSLLYLLDVRALAWAVAGGITHSLLDGGAAKARVRAADAETQLADLAYRKTVAQAWGEARIGLGQLSQAAAAEQRADAVLDNARRALAVSEERHRAGLADGLSLIAAQQNLERATARVAQARAAGGQAYVDLVLACGGEVS